MGRCPHWSNSGQTPVRLDCPLSAKGGHAARRSINLENLRNAHARGGRWSACATSGMVALAGFGVRTPVVPPPAAMGAAGKAQTKEDNSNQSVGSFHLNNMQPFGPSR